MRVEVRTLGWLEAVAGATDRGEPLPSALGSDARRALEGELAARPPTARPDDLVARPASLPPGVWHLRALEAALAGSFAGRDPSRARAVRARIRYHARWLAHLLQPDDPARAPRVSVVVPFFGEEEFLPRAVRGALSQTWPRLEVVVVDDGSPHASAAKVLSSLPSSPERPVRVARQENGGVASARNLGIRMARGELVHFLDVDDELFPEAVARKVEALRCVPDAELACSGYVSAGDSGWRGAGSHTAPEFGDADCPTRDLLRCALQRYPFHTSSVLVARCRLLEGSFFDERLERGSDTRMWIALGLRGTKVAALRSALGTRHFHPHSLTAVEQDRHLVRPAVLLLTLDDLLAEPARWRFLGLHAVRMSRRLRWQPIDEEPDAVVEEARRALCATVEKLGREGRMGGFTVRLPLLVVRRHLVERTCNLATRGRLRQPLAAALERALRRAPAPTPADVGLWLSGPERADAGNRVALDDLLRWMDRRLLLGPLAGLLGHAAPSRDDVLHATELWKSHPTSARLRLWARGETGALGLLARRVRRALGPRPRA
jgi:hypothetical protein